MDSAPADDLPLFPAPEASTSAPRAVTRLAETPRERRSRLTAERRAAERAAVAARKEARKPTTRLTAAVTAALADLARADRAEPATLDDEIFALVASVDERASNVLLRRWGYREWPAPTLESLGAEHGITRERTRQIEAVHEERLHEIRPSLPPLPLATRAAEILSKAGGALPAGAFRAALDAANVTASEAALRVLPKLGDLGFIAPMRYLPTFRLFAIPSVVAAAYSDAADSANPEVATDPSLAPVPAPAESDAVAIGMDRFEGELQHALTRARRALRRVGVIPLVRVADAVPLSPSHVVEIALEGRPWRSHSGYAVPVAPEAEDTTLAREVASMLAASERLRLADVRLGLRRVTPRPIKLPVNVIAEALRPRQAFVLDRGELTLRTLAAAADAAAGDPGAYAAALAAERAARLRHAEVAVVEAMEPRDGHLTLTEMHAVLAAAGHNSSWMLAVSQAPFLLKLAPSVYGLLGREIPASAVLAARRGDTGGGWRSRRGGRLYERVLVSREVDADSGAFRLAYRVTPGTMRGALRLPNRVARAIEGSEGDWPVRGAQGSLSVRGGTLWDVSGWVRDLGAEEGDHVSVVIDVEARALELRRVPADEAAAAEVTVAAQRAARASRRTAAERERLRVLRERLREERRVARQARLDARRRLAEERRAAQAARAERLVHRETGPTLTPDTWVDGGRWAYVEGRYLQIPRTPITLDQVRLVYLEDLDPVHGDVVVGVYPDFPLAPGMRGVVMGVVVRLDAGRGKRRFVGGLIEQHLLDRGRPLSSDEADLLVPEFSRVLTEYRTALAWREYRPPQLDLLPQESA